MLDANKDNSGLRSLGAAASGVVAPPEAADTSARAQLAAALQPLGQTGLTPTLLGMGTGTRAWDQDSAQIRRGREVFLGTLIHAYERGLRYYDLADLYGSHQYMRDAMREGDLPREELTLLTKTMARDPKKLRLDLDRFRLEVDTDYFDIVLLHGMSRGNWDKKLAACMDVLSEAKEEGIVRAVGVSCHNFEAMETAAELDWVEVMLSRINPFQIKMDGTPADVAAVLQKAHANGKGNLGMKIMGDGDIADKRAETLRYVFGLGCIDAITVGFLNSDEVDDAIDHIEAALRPD